ncbi:class I SAM-dependent methyltransferase [Paraburkholderia megapolitana]|uniref:class I SAM-dependent methyltransferase n=1 Tax=Paraburkholderia megapolitana TaxID=420953 RepID=UPI0038BD3D41
MTSTPLPAAADASNAANAASATAGTHAMPWTMGSDDWNRRYATKDFIWTVEANDCLLAETANLPPGRALDLAAGEARNAVWLAEQGWTVHAVDFSDVAIGKAKELAAARKVDGRISFEVADLTRYEPEGRSYDLVVLFYLQLPFAELAPILARAAKAVAPGGTFLLVAHDSSNLTHGYGGPQHPEVLYAAEQVVAALGGELEIERALPVERLVKTRERTGIAIDCLVRGRRA